MAPTRERSRDVYQCVEPFAIYNRAGVPEVFNRDRMVFGDDPILSTHRHMFELSADRLERSQPRPAQPAAPRPPQVRSEHIEES